MPTVKERHQEQIDQLVSTILDEVDELVDIDGDSFLLWAADKYLQPVDDHLSSEDLEVCITDGKDDLGLDMYYVDEEAEVIYLFQSKLRTRTNTVKRPEIDSVLALPGKLMDGKALRNINNERLVDFAVRFRQCVDQGYEIKVVYLTTERPTPQINSSIESWNRLPLPLGQHSNVEHSAEIADTEALLTRSTALMDQPDVDLQFAHHYFDPGNNDSPRSIGGMLSASELLRIWHAHGFAMFRDNPRGPLAAARVNKNIAKTLDDEIDKVRFHLLNNGLTAVCDSFTSPVNQKVTVRDLQIVNGCQTTWTIYDFNRRGGDVSGVYVTLKLVETQKSDTLIGAISSSSNTQNAMLDWDFLFNREDQRRLQREFENLNPPLFYELKRGEKKHISGSKHPKITIKDAAQAMWAFMGNPGSALDRAREIPRSHKATNGTYYQVFYPGINARQLTLPFQIHNKVKQMWKRDNPDRSSSLTGDSRLHLVWLIGQIFLRELGVSDLKSVDSRVLQLVNDEIDVWIEESYGLAVRVVEVVIERYTGENATDKVSLRQLFRNDSYTKYFQGELDFNLRRYPAETLRRVINQ